MKQIALAIMGWLALLTTVQAASFDCNKATSQVEKLICSSEKVSELDNKLQDAYSKAMPQVLDANSLKIEQRNWLKIRDTQCKDEKCLATAYEFRIKALLVESEPLITKYIVVNKMLGKYRLEIRPNGYQAARTSIYDDFRSYVFLIYDKNGKQLQAIDVHTRVPPDQLLSIIDMDSDGYNDLLVIIGYGAGPFSYTDLYRYNKTSNLFERDKSFPSRGYSTPSEHAGCVYIEDRSSPDHYEITEWCLSSDTNEWSEDQSCPSTENCFSRLEKFQEDWQRHHLTE